MLTNQTSTFRDYKHKILENSGLEKTSIAKTSTFRDYNLTFTLPYTPTPAPTCSHTIEIETLAVPSTILKCSEEMLPLNHIVLGMLTTYRPPMENLE